MHEALILKKESTLNRPSVRQFTLVFLLALAFMSPLTMAVEATPPAEPNSWLFVEDAAGGSLTGPDDQHLKLKLKRMRRNITPITVGYHDAVVDSLLSNEEFFTDWPKTFADEPQPAVLSYDLPGKSQPTNIILTLTNPKYDAVKRTVMFDAARLVPGVVVTQALDGTKDFYARGEWDSGGILQAAMSDINLTILPSREACRVLDAGMRAFLPDLLN